MANSFEHAQSSAEKKVMSFPRSESAPVWDYVGFSSLEADRTIRRLVAIPGLPLAHEDQARIAGSYDRMARKTLDRLAARPENAHLYTRLKWAIEKLEQEFPEIGEKEERRAA